MESYCVSQDSTRQVKIGGPHGVLKRRNLVIWMEDSSPDTIRAVETRYCVCSPRQVGTARVTHDDGQV